MSLTDVLRTALPYDSRMRRYARWAYEDTRNLARMAIPWHPDPKVAPHKLYIETTNICNANCIFCAYQYQKVFRARKGVMEDNLFARVLREYKAMGGKIIDFTPIVGDPLVDPKIVDRVALAREMGFSVQFFTNGILLNRIDVEALLRTGISQFCLSTSPFDRESHQRIYRTHHYDDLLNGVVKLLETRDKLGASFALSIEFRSDMSSRETLALPDFVNEIQPRLTEDENRGIRIMTKVFDTWGGQIAASDLTGNMRLAVPPKIKRKACFRTYYPQVLYDGKIRACSCVFSRHQGEDSDDGLLIGDLADSSLEEIWNGERLANVRRQFGSGDLPPVCRHCSIYRAC